jgi:hypothetical protein
MISGEYQFNCFDSFLEENGLNDIIIPQGLVRPIQALLSQVKVLRYFTYLELEFSRRDSEKFFKKSVASS